MDYHYNKTSRYRFGMAHLLDRWQPSEAIVLGGAALFVGLGSGAGVWLFKRMIEFAHFIFFEKAGALLYFLGPWRAMPLPVIGGLLVGLFLFFSGGKRPLQGISEMIEAVAMAGGRICYQLAPIKAIASALSIGAGASVGPEDPSVQIGASLGSMLGQKFRLSDERIRTLVAAGAAGGISAAFNAPIAGVFFSLEIVLGEISGRALGIVVLSSVISAIFTQWVSGPEPAFHVSRYAFNAVRDLPLYLLLGLFSGSVSAIYIRLLYVAKDTFSGLHVPNWLKPPIAGIFLGLVGVFLPQVFGIGYETIGRILAGEHFSVLFLIVILIAKLIMTPLSIGGGFQGGVFAPALFLGAALGAAYGGVIQALFPSFGVDPPAFGVIGMAALLAGAVHAPLTAILLLFEMTNDYKIILPLMFAVTVSVFVSQRIERNSIYMFGLARRGIRIERGRDVEVLDGIQVSSVMQTGFQVLHESDSITIASDLFMKLRTHGLPVINSSGELAGILTMQDLDVAVREGKKMVGEACTRDIVSAFPDETLGAALRRMGVRDIGRLPVVARDNPRRLVGVLRRSDIIRAYDLALTQRAMTRHHIQQVRLGAISGARVEELTIRRGSSCVGCRISEIAWPKECIIASIRRGHELLIPHGDTVLKEGDVLTIVAAEEVDSSKSIHSLCQKG